MLFRLGPRQYAVVGLTLLIGVPTLFLGLGGSRWSYAWYYESMVGRDLRKVLGFETGTLKHDSGERTSWWGITAVSSGGAFEQAAVRAGDVPLRVSYVSTVDGTRKLRMIWYHGETDAITSFYEFLERSRGRGPVSFTVCAVELIDTVPCPEREITVTVPEELRRVG